MGPYVLFKHHYQLQLKMKRIIFIMIICLAILSNCSFKHQQENVVNQQKYMIYLHGGIVQEQGINAVSPYYGKYEYLAIVDSLRSQGIAVISEVRKKGTEDKAYAVKVKSQIDSLLAKGVKPLNISVVGASAGAYIAMETAIIVKQPEIKFALIGLCSDYALNYFSAYKDHVVGDFLSIFESSDSKQSCSSIFKEPHPQVRFKEIQLNMGINHSFLFQPHDEWVKPLVEWVRE
jgi:hypothetical protein